jgi:hypothetical protein
MALLAGFRDGLFTGVGSAGLQALAKVIDPFIRKPAAAAAGAAQVADQIVGKTCTPQTVTTDCGATGYVCTNGRCAVSTAVTRIACNTENAATVCAAGQVCKDGFCQASNNQNNTCSKDQDCSTISCDEGKTKVCRSGSCACVDATNDSQLTIDFTCSGQIANLASNTTVTCTSQVNKTENVTYNWEFKPSDSNLVTYATKDISVQTVPRGQVTVKLTVTSGSESETTEKTINVICGSGTWDDQNSRCYNPEVV